MNPFRNLSIKVKLILLCLVPMVGLAFYLQNHVREELAKKQAAETLILQVNQIDKMGELVHHLQFERFLSGTYIYVRRETSREALLSQREATDRAIADLNTFLNENQLHTQNIWLLDSLPSFRERTDRLELTDRDNIRFQDGRMQIIIEMNKILNASQAVTNANSLDNHITLLYAKEYLSLLRAQIAEAMVNSLFDEKAYGIFYNNQTYRNFASTKGRYDIYMNKLLTAGEPEIVNALKKVFEDPAVKETFATLNIAYTDPRFSNQGAAALWTRNDNASESVRQYDRWHKVSTEALNRLREIENLSSKIIKTYAGQQVSQANRAVTITLVIGVLIVLLVFGITLLTVRGIIGSVQEIKTAANLLAIGNIDAIRLKVASKDEIGELAVAFEEIIASNRDFSRAAETFGGGDYTTQVSVRSADDTLGKALAKMRDDLENLSRENESRTWLAAGNSTLNDHLRGDKEISQLGQDVITHLVKYLEAQVGAIYLRDESQLIPIGSYAYQQKINLPNIPVGEGLIGQAALDKKMMVFSDLPDTYIKIRSGLGDTPPKSILVFPVCYQGDVKAVIEIGAIGVFSELHKKLLTLVEESIAIAFNGAQARARMHELLEETQRQAEELQSQQEELHQSNEELQSKTDLLERSEGELRLQQEELQQTNEELEEKANLLEEQKEKLEASKVDVERKARELETISKYKSEFLANMSHELRTPLNSILILSQLLSDNKSQVLGEKEIEFAKNIHNSGNNLLNLINEILDLSKVESGKMQLDVEEVSFKEITRDVTSLFSEVARTKSVHFDIHVSDAIGDIILTDPLRLQQIVRNLLSNAFKFTDKGGHVELSIAKANNVTYLNPHLAVVPDMIAFAVKDSGIGIPAEKQGLIFEAFQQADGSTKRKYGGTGLGLSICRELASALGGEIQLVSYPGEGSTFTLYIPLKFTGERTIIQNHPELTGLPKEQDQRQNPVADTNSSEEVDFTSDKVTDDRETIRENDKVVLIMEDDKAFADIVLGFVRERKCKGIVAYQGNTGLSLARQYKPDAIILDMKLPVIDGSEVLKQLKLDPAMRHIPVQIISGYDLKKEVMELGALGFIKKPISKEDFQQSFDRIEDFVDRKIKKLLIVEDNELQNKAIRELITVSDVKCFSSYSGNEAFDLLHKEKFDCIIVDLGLPDMTGFELLDKIKNDEAINTVPVIVYTGRDLSKAETQKLNKLANAVVLKTAESHERLLDETLLFLHQMESKLPKEKQTIIRKLYKTDEVLKNKTVLIVDDDIRNIYSLTNVLGEEEMICLVAENGQLAVNTLKENPQIEIVLMDVMMPEMDGYEATRAIRMLADFEKLPIIALTAKAMKGDRDKCLAAGMSDYISKPINVEQLLSLMRVWLYKK